MLSRCMIGRTGWVHQAGSSEVENEKVKGAGFVPRESVFRCLAHGLFLPVSPMYLWAIFTALGLLTSRTGPADTFMMPGFALSW